MECVEDYFIFNGEIKSTLEFDDKYVKVGEVLYEVIRVIKGEPLYLEEHLRRLDNTAKITNRNLWLNSSQIEAAIYKLINKSKVDYGNIKIIFNFNDMNNFLIYFLEHSYPTPNMYKDGVHTIIYKGERTNPNAKVVDLTFRSIVNEEIKRSNAFEAILVDRNGFVTEGSKSNIFMIKGDKVITSPTKDVLPGVTREVILDILRKLKIEICEEKVHYNDIKNLDALFISGTSPKVLPIKSVGKDEFLSSSNKILKLIMDKYNSDVEKYIYEKSRCNIKD
ncbi:aminotransferase class IV [Haloimpatiens sp. FM7315]|uniref:aminotransferase class IV n=1 Tax=Haloimpatiens sp. FM7315 TaxID=3298609 RepID=UPI0035A355E1